MWESKIDIRQVAELRCRTICYLGVGAIAKIDAVAADLKGRNIDKALIMTGKTPTRSPALGSMWKRP